MELAAAGVADDRPVEPAVAGQARARRTASVRTVDRGRWTCATRCRVGAELRPAVDQRDRVRRSVRRRQAPSRRRCRRRRRRARLAGVRVSRARSSRQAPAEELGPGRQRPRGERADAARDHDGPRHRRAPCGGDREQPAVGAAAARRPAAPSSAAPARMCSPAPPGCDQVAPAHGGEPGDVVDQLLRVHRGDLAARLRQRIDDGRPHAPEPGVVGRVQPDRPGAEMRMSTSTGADAFIDRSFQSQRSGSLGKPIRRGGRIRTRTVAR